MSKKRFIQAVVARSLPAHGKLGDAVKYAENLWDGLTQYGYGQDDPAKPRASRNWVDVLDERQRAQFKAFWGAFAYKKDINSAAMRWHQLGALSDEQAQVIIDAAKKEAYQPVPPGQNRKMAQGWLFERRWLDYQPQTKDVKRQRNHVLTHLKNELAAVKRLHEAAPDNALQQQIEQLEHAIAHATRKP